jgi:hypothetical protein
MFDFITVNSIERSVLAVTQKNSNKLSLKNFLLCLSNHQSLWGSFFLCLAEKFFGAMESFKVEDLMLEQRGKWQTVSWHTRRV